MVCLGACVNVLRDVKRGCQNCGEVARLVERFLDLWRGCEICGEVARIVERL